MGWGSACALFDASVDVTLFFMPDCNTMPVMIQAVVEKTYKDIDWEDWDTQGDSKYWPYLVHVMHGMGEIGDEEYEEALEYLTK